MQTPRSPPIASTGGADRRENAKMAIWHRWISAPLIIRCGSSAGFAITLGVSARSSRLRTPAIAAF
jgi:hypothetical protein